MGAKDLILGLIAQETSAGANGYVVEYTGEAIRALSMEGRMTVSNMSIEWGRPGRHDRARRGHVRFLEGRPGVRGTLERAVERWSRADDRRRCALSTREVVVDAAALAPQVTWGTNPGQTVPITGRVPEPRDDGERRGARVHGPRGRAPPMEGIAVDRVFIGSCTNSRIGDLRAAAEVVRGRRVAVPALVVPGSMAVKRAAEAEGLDRVFLDAGCEWRNAGCSMCLGMNPDCRRRRRARGLDIEPQLRGPAGPRRALPPPRPRNGRSSSPHRAADGCARTDDGV